MSKKYITLDNLGTFKDNLDVELNKKQNSIDSSNKLNADLVNDATSENKFVTTTEKSTWSGKQDALVSGTNIKTINNTSILGSGNIDTTYTAGTGLVLDNREFSVDDTVVALKEDLPSGNVDLEFNGTETSTIETLSNIIVDDTTYKVPTYMSNPMTTAGDIIVGGTNGTPSRLAKGTAGQVLTMNAGATAPEWAAVPNELPTVTSSDKNKVLHTNDTTGALEWTTITGGSGIQNYEVIVQESSLPTATATSPDFVEVNEVLYRKNATTSSEPSDTVTDLTNTKWLLNDTLQPTWPIGEWGPVISPNITFISNGETYNKFTHYFNIGAEDIGLDYDSTNVYYYDLDTEENVWTNQAYKTISITGGTDATAAYVIEWLQGNATQIIEPVTTYSYELVDEKELPALTGNANKVLKVNANADGIEWVSESASGGDIFTVIYGTTTFAQITQALSDGKLPVCFYNNNEYVYVGLSATNRYTFSSQLFDSNRYISVNNSDSWGNGSNNLEIVSNKVTSISSSSTDTQYPSAKAVYDSLATKSTVSVSNTGTATDEVNYITIDGTEKKLAGGATITFVDWS